MNKDINIINKLLVDIFYDILQIEQKSLQYASFKDLSISEIHTIAAIGMYVPRRMTEVAGDLDITLGTLTTAVKHLVKKGYVIRERSELDRRIVRINLTKKGKLAYRIHQKFHSDMVKECISGLSEEEKKVLKRSLEKLNEFFKSKYDIDVKVK
ncbi:MAG: MarR family winged helix-turn-helix transcriptional regulator [Clostridium sp.]|uniref:MarR family winged helix-turn-helix transcriptional regulator n=1 Tax=Clostridium sp. TaxID=1506 RepID=UPI0025C6B78B|nr:MarR family winged helix-turn-helix transcriptional regulator [Clostridium sp.]MCH3965564.1 MarR family winged helix-turn-helix transcriptional regulator [Clostridium sp.]MCI1716892.1 MarR family winged helix-turn-helix transcriptional regulator [Clostridium sp.]MCI1801178.1 MarR family winged helix-turn-helix transcriptional regulator [Clostridium sp.]MCI1815078.1 MarR family winged helix-turn-helix transcriptional regulator [Clostridium sp.]MCI1871981.1 MarR family winged helix-turn-helix